MEKSISKAWEWSLADKKEWLEPAPEAYALARRWKEEGKKDFLDFGTGLGRHSLFFASEGFAIKGFDLSSEAVMKTEETLKAKGYHASIVQSDMLHIPFPDGSVDCLLAYHVLSHTDTAGIKEVFKEIHRLLRSGGEAYFDLCAADSLDYDPKNPDFLDPHTKIIAHEGPEKDIPHFFATEEMVRALLSDFEILSLKRVRTLVLEGKPSKRDHFWALIRKH